MRERPARPNIEHLRKYKRLTGPIPGQTADTQGDTNSLVSGKLKEHQGSVHRGRNDHNAASIIQKKLYERVMVGRSFITALLFLGEDHMVSRKDIVPKPRAIGSKVRKFRQPLPELS